ncbi:hypothetical protein WUBG_18491 [Wuchereria bancrofti]|uniref:Laminin G domain-containing protein n=1 Tax=Wuchereria bancrofti TaxID=6293 RepID=J9E5J0_WUCBA|nr:hypothetical protein WUBG_18491 [Wuchereria bancrofti]
MTGGLHEENFIGCIGDIIFNGIKMDLMANAIDGRNVKPCDQWMIKKNGYEMENINNCDRNKNKSKKN